jgi:cytochrome c oxidase cbb3-type subunit III
MSSPCHSTWNLRGLAAAALILGGTACERESRRFETGPTAAAPDSAVRQVELQPGPATDTSQVSGPYDGNAYAVSEGKRLYHQMNCSGCHFQGGGGIGPPLMDAEWIYGSAGRNIFETIVEGRPNGMPSFRGKLGDDQVWQLVAYVRSLSGLGGSTVSSAREDHMYLSPDLALRSAEKPTRSTPRP